MYRVALTGNIASGKSAVAQVWSRLGASIIDADELARRAASPGSPGLERIVAEFGTSVLTPEGELDRAALRSVVFAEDRKRQRLESILHPEIARLRLAEEARLEARGVRIVVHVIPLLFEVGLQHAFDAVVVVEAPEEMRLARIVAGRGLGAEEARRMIAAQMPAESKRAEATIVIENRGTVTELEFKAEQVWHELEALSGRNA
jgi:dephospho-CoA kinase